MGFESFSSDALVRSLLLPWGWQGHAPRESGCDSGDWLPRVQGPENGERQRERKARSTPQEPLLDVSNPRTVICCDNLRFDNKNYR